MMKRALGRHVFLATSLMTLAAVPAAAQVPLTPRSLGTADALLAAARGHEALFLNPANLGLPDRPRGSVAIAQFGFGGTLNGTTIDDLPDLIGAGDLEPARQAEVFAKVPVSGISSDLDLRVPVVTLQIGRLAVGLAYGQLEELGLSRNLIELMIFGYEEGRGDYDFNGTAGSRAQFWDLAVGYGRSVGPLSVGVTGHYIHGRSLQQWWLNQPRFEFGSGDIEALAPAAVVRGGIGFGLDVGAALQPTTGVTLSAAIANAFGYMNWSDDLRIRTFTLRNEHFDNPDEVWEFIIGRQGDERDATAADAAILRGLNADRLQREAYFPTTLRLGAAWQPAAGTSLMAAFNSALTDGRLAGTSERRVALGLEQKLAFIRLRAGIGTDLDERTMLAGGLSLGPLQLGAARINISDSAVERSGYIITLGFSTTTY